MTTKFLKQLTLLAVPAVLLAACATPGPKERMEDRLALYEQIAGEPVDSFWYPRTDSWEPLSENRLVVWTDVRRGYLMTVDRPCRDLEWVHTIGLTSSTSRVHARFDQVLAGQDRCRITEIRPVMRADLRSAERAQRQAVAAEQET